MIKRKLVTILTISLLFGLSACSGTQSDTKDNTITPTTQVSSPEVVTPTQEAAASTQEAAPTQAADDTANDSNKKKLTSYYEAIGTADDNYEFAAAYVGYFTPENTSEEINAYAAAHNLTDHEVADCAGLECYVIIPKYDDSTIKIETFSDFEQKSTEQIIETKKPVFILSNPSDLWANTQITVVNKDKTYVFSPSVSLKDGSILLPEEANQNLK